MDNFNFGDNQNLNTHELFGMPQRSQLQYPLDNESKGALELPVKIISRELKKVQSITVPAGATSFEVRGDVMEVTGAAGVTIATIEGGYDGQVLTLIFTDANITITDTTFSVGTNNTVNLSAAFTSTQNDVMRLVYHKLSWFEVSRSVN